MDAAFAQINDAIGEDVQEIDPDVGVGNVSKYVGPALMPDGAKGRAFTAKVKIGESPGTKEKEASQPAPPVSVLEVERGAAGERRARGRAMAVALVALGVVVVAAGVWVVAKGPGQQGVGVRPVAAGSGSASVAPAVPSAEASGAVVESAPPVAPRPMGTSEVDAGASLAPRGPTRPAPYKPKSRAVKGEDPYEAAPVPVPVPAKTVEPVVPPPSLSVIPSPPPPIGGNRVFGN